MLIKITLLKKAFFFLEGLNLKKADGEVEVDLSDKSDSFKATIARSIVSGILTSDADPAEIVELVENELFKSNLKGDVTNISDTSFSDEIETVAEVVAVEVEEEESEDEEAEEAEEAEESESEDAPSVEEIDEALGEDISEILKGTNKSVSNKIRNADLSADDKAALLAIEKDGRNRTVIKKLLEA